jgi:hypothetical protein
MCCPCQQGPQEPLTPGTLGPQVPAAPGADCDRRWARPAQPG